MWIDSAWNSHGRRAADRSLLDQDRSNGRSGSNDWRSGSRDNSLANSARTSWGWCYEWSRGLDLATGTNSGPRSARSVRVDGRNGDFTSKSGVALADHWGWSSAHEACLGLSSGGGGSQLPLACLFLLLNLSKSLRRSRPTRLGGSLGPGSGSGASWSASSWSSSSPSRGGWKTRLRNDDLSLRLHLTLESSATGSSSHLLGFGSLLGFGLLDLLERWATRSFSWLLRPWCDSNAGGIDGRSGRAVARLSLKLVSNALSASALRSWSWER
jgi:hypothetical protein